MQDIEKLFLSNQYKVGIKKFKKYENSIVNYTNESKNVFLYFTLGSFYYFAKDDKNALHYLEQASHSNPNASGALFYIGSIKLSSNNIREAQHYFRKSIDIKPDSMAYASLAYSLLKTNEYDKAIESYEKALNLDGDNKRLRNQYINVLWKLGKYDKSEKFHLKLLKDSPQNTKLLYEIAQLNQTMKKHKKALEFFQKAYKIEPENWKYLQKVIQVASNLPYKDTLISKSITKMYTLWEKDKKLQKRGYFQRDYFQNDFVYVFVYEFFELKGKYPMKYQFRILDKKTSKLKYKFSLGSYESTTAILREIGDIRKDERMYHLDKYGPNGHSTYGMFKILPKYTSIKKIVRTVIEKKLKPFSRIKRSQTSHSVK